MAVYFLKERDRQKNLPADCDLTLEISQRHGVFGLTQNGYCNKINSVEYKNLRIKE